MVGPKSCHPVSLLCIPVRIVERLIYARVKLVIDPLLPQEQAVFRHWKSTRSSRHANAKHLKLAFWLSGSKELRLSMSQQPTTLHGIAAKLLRQAHAQEGHFSLFLSHDHGAH